MWNTFLRPIHFLINLKVFKISELNKSQRPRQTCTALPAFPDLLTCSDIFGDRFRLLPVPHTKNASHIWRLSYHDSVDISFPGHERFMFSVHLISINWDYRMITVYVELAGVLEARNAAYFKALFPGWRTQRNPSDILFVCWHTEQTPPDHYLLTFGKMRYASGGQDCDRYFECWQERLVLV